MRTGHTPHTAYGTYHKTTHVTVNSKGDEKQFIKTSLPAGGLDLTLTAIFPAVIAQSVAWITPPTMPEMQKSKRVYCVPLELYSRRVTGCQSVTSARVIVSPYLNRFVCRRQRAYYMCFSALSTSQIHSTVE